MEARGIDEEDGRNHGRGERMKRITALLLLFFLVLQSAGFSLSPSEMIIKQGSAGLVRNNNAETVKGTLYVTRTRLVFEPHYLNARGATIRVGLRGIAAVETGWSKFLGVPYVIPNALKITMRNGPVYRFTCYWPSRWKTAIERQARLR